MRACAKPTRHSSRGWAARVGVDCFCVVFASFCCVAGRERQLAEVIEHVRVQSVVAVLIVKRGKRPARFIGFPGQHGAFARAEQCLTGVSTLRLGFAYGGEVRVGFVAFAELDQRFAEKKLGLDMLGMVGVVGQECAKLVGRELPTLSGVMAGSHGELVIAGIGQSNKRGDSQQDCGQDKFGNHISHTKSASGTALAPLA